MTVKFCYICGQPTRLRYPGGDPECGPARAECPDPQHPPLLDLVVEAENAAAQMVLATVADRLLRATTLEQFATDFATRYGMVCEPEHLSPMDYATALDQLVGFCLTCDDWVNEGATEPDAVSDTCNDCECKTVVGVRTAVEQDIISVVEERPDGEV